MGRLRSRSKAARFASLVRLLISLGAGCRRKKREDAALVLVLRIIVNDHRRQASSHRGTAHASTIRSAVRPPRFACDFDLRRPVKPRWPSSDIDLGGNPAGRRVSRAGPWMAHRGGPPNQCRMTGTPSLGEVPSGGARALLVTFGWAGTPGSFPKVTRCKSGTNSRHDRSNGYVHKPRRELCSDLRPSRTSPLPH